MTRSYGQVLDVACGNGRNFLYYPEGCSLSAVDISSGMLAIARKRVHKSGRKVDFYLADTEILPFKDESFDCVVDSLGLCTFSNPVKSLQEMRRVCKPNGLVLLLEHGESSNFLIRSLQKFGEDNHLRKKGCFLTRNPLAIVQESGLNIQFYHRYLLGIIYFIIATK